MRLTYIEKCILAPKQVVFLARVVLIVSGLYNEGGLNFEWSL